MCLQSYKAIKMRLLGSWWGHHHQRVFRGLRTRWNGTCRINSRAENLIKKLLYTFDTRRWGCDVRAFRRLLVAGLVATNTLRFVGLTRELLRNSGYIKKGVDVLENTSIWKYWKYLLVNKKKHNLKVMLIRHLPTTLSVWVRFMATANKCLCCFF